MTVLVQIRDVDGRVCGELKSRAAVEGTSLNASLKSLLEQAADSPRRSDVFERIRARVRAPWPTLGGGHPSRTRRPRRDPTGVSVSAVVDCSVGVDLLVSEDQDIFMSTLPHGAWHVPDLLDIEVISALRGLHLGRHLTLPRVNDALRDYTDPVFTRWSAGPEMRTRIFALGGNLTAYDATYVALVEALHLPLITRDKRMASSVRRWPRADVLRSVGAPIDASPSVMAGRASW